MEIQRIKIGDHDYVLIGNKERGTITTKDLFIRGMVGLAVIHNGEIRGMGGLKLEVGEIEFLDTVKVELKDEAEDNLLMWSKPLEQLVGFMN